MAAECRLAPLHMLQLQCELWYHTQQHWCLASHTTAGISELTMVLQAACSKAGVLTFK